MMKESVEMPIVTRFEVAGVSEVAPRGRCVSGEVVEGVVKVGMYVHPQGMTRPMHWRVIGIEYADSPSLGVSRIALVLENAPPLEELRRLLPPGTVLVASSPTASMETGSG